jgi:protocatechuate 3,4-dioxygenase beta subunit
MQGRLAIQFLAGLSLLVLLALILQLTGLFDFTALGRTPERVADTGMLADLEERLFEEMRRGATLRGLPGVESGDFGSGVLTGKIKLLVLEAGPQPLGGVAVQLLGHGGGGRGGKFEHAAETDAEGVFSLNGVPAHVGYVLLIDHPPYRRIVLRGIGVERDRTTDVGVILLGAPTALGGEVLDARGRPVPGATVQVLRDRSQGDSFDLRGAIFELQSAMNFVAEARAEVDGSFVVRDLPPARYVLRVSAPGYATTFRTGVLVTPDENSTNVRVVLDPGSGFEGRVLDEAGRPLAGARVIAVAIPGKTLNRFDRIDVTTGSDGRYRIDTLVTGMLYGVEAWAEGYAPTGRPLTTGEGVREVDFRLVRSGRIEGRVTDADTGAGVPDCQVTVLAGPIVGVSPVSTVTDAGGGFVLEHVNPGPVIVFSAKAEGYQPGDRADLKSVNGLRVTSGETTWVDWKLRAGGSVSGRVTSDAGRPVAYARVALIDRRRSRQRWTGEISAMTDVDGRYELVGVREGTYDLHVGAAGFAPVFDGEETKVEMPGDLGAMVKDVVLARGAAIVGVVTAPDDTPLRGARVRLEGPEPGHQPTSLRDLTAVSGAAGRFRIRGVPPGVAVVVVAEHDVYVAGRSAVQRLAAGQERTVSVALREGIALPGRVVDRSGAGVGNARVRWGHVDGVRERDLRDSFTADGFLGPRVLRTDADGRFLIERLAPGRLMVKIEHEDHAPWYRKDALVPASGEPSAITARLEPTFRISGRVLAGDTGRPIAGAYVYARERSPGDGQPADPGRVQAIVSRETDADGRYVLEPVPPGLHDVVVWIAEGYVAEIQRGRNPNERRENVPAGAAGIDFRLDPVPAPE